MALADIKVGGQTIPAGDGAVFALGIGNRDSAALARPVDPDIARGARGHLAFGFGLHQCPGQSLSRTL